MFAKTLIAAAVATLAVAASASAETYEFRYQPYELATKGGRAALMARLDDFVERKCDADSARGLAARRSAAECVLQVKAEIMDKIDNVQFAGLE